MKIEFDRNRIKLHAEQAKKDFWTNEKLPFQNNELLDFYNDNEVKWLENAVLVRKIQPVKTNILLANIYRSNFSFKLIGDRINFFDKKKRYTISDKISIIKSAFENSYDHFALLTICANYKPNFIDSLYVNWEMPDKAREFIKEENQNPWKSNNEKISGKKWTLINCPLFKYIPLPISYLGLIKNADSHQKLVIAKDTIIVLDPKGKHLSIKIKDLNRLFKYVKNAIFLAMSFNLALAVKNNFWITPVLLITNSEKFNYKKINLPNYNQIENSRKKKTTSKNKKEFDIKKTELFIGLILAFCEFIFIDMWKKIKEDETNINLFLDEFNFKFDIEKFDSFQKDAVKSVIELFISMNDKVKEWDLKDVIEKPSFTMTESLDDFNLEDFILDFITTFKRIKKLDNNKTKNFAIFFLIHASVSIIVPLGLIHESLKEIIIEK